MTNKILEGMARRHYGAFAEVHPDAVEIEREDIAAMRAALLWLADNISDEMISAAYNADTERGNAKVYIAAALRQAALAQSDKTGGGDE